MADEIQIHIDEAELRKNLERLKGIKDGTPKAVMRSMNRTVGGMKTDSWSLVKKLYTVKKMKDFNDKLAAEKASLGNLSITLRSRGRPMRAVKFNYRKNRSNSGTKKEYLGRSFRRAKRAKERGLDSTRRKRGGGGWNRGRKPAFLRVMSTESGGYIRGGFMASFTPGKDSSAGDGSLSGIFVRAGRQKKPVKSGKYKGSLKEPIRQIYSPGSVQMLKNETIKAELQEKAVERLNKELDHEINYILSKK